MNTAGAELISPSATQQGGSQIPGHGAPTGTGSRVAETARPTPCTTSSRSACPTTPPPRAYRESHLAKGWTIKAVFRALKRAIAREVFRSLTGQCTVPDYTDLRPARRAKNLTLTAAAAHLGVWPARIGELELGRRPNDQLAAAYRDWAQRGLTTNRSITPG